MTSADSEPRLSARTIQPLAATRVGLLGGSFNPIHNGHLAIAGQVRTQLDLDRVLFIPTGDPPHKREGTLAPARDRYEMVRLAIENTPFFVISDIEVRRAGKSYSIDTIREIKRQLGPATDLYFIIGLDAFLEFSSWKEPQELLKSCRFVVVSRPGQSFHSLAQHPILPGLDTRALAQLDAGDRTRLDITLPDCQGIICLSLPPSTISASDIRQRAQRNAALANVLPPSVESYILRHRLYQEDRNRTHI